MADLITRARALYNLNNLATTSDENTAAEHYEFRYQR